MKIIEFKKKEAFIEKFSYFAQKTRTVAQKNIISPPLMKQLLLLSSNFNSNFWMIENNQGQILGHIGANVSNFKKEFGYIGFFELDIKCSQFKEVGKELISLAINWLQKKSVQSIYGPLNYNTWFPYRFRIDNSPEEFIWEPNQPREYIKTFTNHGFKVEEKYYTVCTNNITDFIKRNEEKLNQCIDSGYTFSIIKGEEFNQLLEEIYKITLESYKDAILFEPIDFETLKNLYYPLANKGNFFCVKVEDQNKNLAGYLICFYAQDSLILKTQAISIRHQGQGLSTAMICFSHKIAFEKKLKKIVFALFHESNARVIKNAQKEKPLWIHEYHLYSFKK